jgi:Tfp pilus assembly protein PilO
MAHEKVKKFKESLSGGPGPGFSFSILEIEVNHFIDLAKQFLEEGVGVDKMRDQLSSLSTQVEKLIEHVPSPKKKPLQKLLADIHSLHRTLEISSDRAAKFDQIIHAWEKYH